MFKRIAAFAEKIHNRIFAIKEVAVFSGNYRVSLATGTADNGAKSIVDPVSYVEMCDEHGVLRRYSLMVTMFEGVEFHRVRHEVLLWKKVERLVKENFPGRMHVICILGETYSVEGK